jgi:heme-degrading monooxygenase HmoA
MLRYRGDLHYLTISGVVEQSQAKAVNLQKKTLEITSISFYKYSKRSEQWWAFKQMRLAYAALSNTPGLKYHKQLGSGAAEGFSIWPDWQVYAQLMVWENKAAFDSFLESNSNHHLNLTKSERQMHILLQAIQYKGSWNGLQPFQVNKNASSESDFMAVITRASIRPRKMLSFWFNVPAVSKHISQQKSLLFAKGIGEWPLIEQATFSIWNKKEAMQDFAYQQKEHREVVKKTREKDWYKEEMFVRFQVLEYFGNWQAQPFAKLFSKKAEVGTKD